MAWPFGPNSALLQRERDGKRLDNAQHDRQVARVLRDLAPAELAFLLQALEVGPNHRHQLQNDRRRMYGMMPKRENRQPAEVAAAEQVDDAQHRALVLLKELLPDIGVDARRGHKRAEAIHRQHRQA
jgi:hypothetical protein